MAVRKFLDLSTRHLPERLGSSDSPNHLGTVEGVVVYPLDVGWLMWVPGKGDEVSTVGAHNIDYPDIPHAVIRIQQVARAFGCDYVLFDRDGPLESGLDTWSW